MTARRRRGQTSFNDRFAFRGIPRPEELMDPVLKQLDDEVLLDQVFDALSKRREASAKTGRPSTPAEVVLRLLVLKHLRSWSYEQLQWDVTGNSCIGGSVASTAAMCPTRRRWCVTGSSSGASYCSSCSIVSSGSRRLAA